MNLRYIRRIAVIIMTTPVMIHSTEQGKGTLEWAEAKGEVDQHPARNGEEAAK